MGHFLWDGPGGIDIDRPAVHPRWLTRYRIAFDYRIADCDV